VTTHQHEDFHRIESPFEGSLIRLRPVEERDIPRIHDLFNDPAVHRTLGITWLEPEAGTRAWWEGVRNNPNAQAFAIESLAGDTVGVCSLEDIHAPSRSAILGIWIGASYWDQGFGTDAVRTLCRFGFQEMNLQRIGLSVFDVNQRGVRAYEKVGFKEEGRRRRGMFVDGAYCDVVMMGLLAEDLSGD
jgi:RimJ/RimL family protein N-acetyltransferase